MQTDKRIAELEFANAQLYAENLSLREAIIGFQRKELSARIPALKMALEKAREVPEESGEPDGPEVE